MSHRMPRAATMREMTAFIERHPSLFIYGNDHNAEMLAKFVRSIGKEVAGLILPEGEAPALAGEKEYPFNEAVSRIREDPKAGVIIQGKYAEEPRHRELGYDGTFAREQVFFFCRGEAEDLAFTLTPRLARKERIEVNIADHCNMNCQMCDHYSGLSKPAFASLEAFRRDMERLSVLTGGEMGSVVILGGEPLLHPEATDFLRVTRENFPETYLALATNGLLLQRWEAGEKENLWQVCHDTRTEIRVTLYPIHPKVAELRRLAEKYDAALDIWAVNETDDGSIKTSTKFPLNLQKNAAKWEYIRCFQLNNCTVLREGKIYPCPMAAHAHIFNEKFGELLETSENDPIDIYQANSWEEIAEHLTKRIPFCDYCEVASRRGFQWKQSSRTIGEYVDD